MSNQTTNPVKESEYFRQLKRLETDGYEIVRIISDRNGQAGDDGYTAENIDNKLAQKIGNAIDRMTAPNFVQQYHSRKK